MPSLFSHSIVQNEEYIYLFSLFLIAGIFIITDISVFPCFSSLLSLLSPPSVFCVDDKLGWYSICGPAYV